MTHDNQRLLALILIALGSLALLTRLTNGAAWLWVGLVAAGFIWAYSRRKQYGLLVTACVLTGVAVGILLEGSWNWTGSFLISLGAGFFAIDQIERKANRWPIYVAGILAALGLLLGLLESGLLTSIWFALLLIVAGIFLITRIQGAKNANRDEWTSATTSSTAAPTPENLKEVTPESQPEPLLEQSKPSAEPEPSEAPKEKLEKAPISQKKVQAVDIEPAQESTHDKLKKDLEKWRRETARAEEKAAYLVLTNESLGLIASSKPKTLKELNAIKGIGKVKLERYGEAILKLVNG